jgi:AraC family transcriptional regulator
MTGRILWHAHTRSACALRLIEYAPGTLLRAHAHDRDSVTLVVRGDLVEGSERGEEHAAELSVVAKPAGLEHDNRFGSAGARTLQIELPRDQRVTTGAIPRAATRWDHAGPACRALLRLLATLDRTLVPTAGSALDQHVHRALAGLRFVSTSDAAPSSWLLELRLALEHESTPIAALARRFGVHPVYLARRFRAQFGISPAAFRRRRRVQRTARALLAANDPLADIALDAGYYDQPHMNRQVHAATGLTPRALRSVSGWIGAFAAHVSQPV